MQTTQLIASIHSQLGIMTWPLSVISVITLLILIERCCFLLIKSRSHSQSIIKQVYLIDMMDERILNQFLQSISERKNTLCQGVVVLLTHKHFRKDLREETVSLWLMKQKQQYSSGLKMLSIIGVISPLIGLLGTVLGLMEMFKGLAATSGAIEPSDLANGLGLAMSTTAAGLLIALPAIFGAQLMQLWTDRIIGNIEHTLNHCNLYLEGINLHNSADNNPIKQKSRCSNEKPDRLASA